jgi:hypothetical protein
MKEDINTATKELEIRIEQKRRDLIQDIKKNVSVYLQSKQHNNPMHNEALSEKKHEIMARLFNVINCDRTTIEKAKSLLDATLRALNKATTTANKNQTLFTNKIGRSEDTVTQALDELESFTTTVMYEKKRLEDSQKIEQSRQSAVNHNNSPLIFQTITPRTRGRSNSSPEIYEAVSEQMQTEFLRGRTPSRSIGCEDLATI